MKSTRRTELSASLTKMMTSVSGLSRRSTRPAQTRSATVVSTHAAKPSPSKLGLVPGERGRTGSILALVTKSANDAASVVAERSAAAKRSSPKRMTQKREARMKNTVFRNASGSRSRHRTTARDLATSRARSIRDFPTIITILVRGNSSIRHCSRNHNHLMSSFRAWTASRPRYIKRLGSISRHGQTRQSPAYRRRHGGASARARDAHMAQLLNAAFATRRGDMMVAKAEEGGESDSAAVIPQKRGIAARAVSALSPVSRAEAAPLRGRRKPVMRKAGERVNRLQHWSVQLERSRITRRQKRLWRQSPGSRGKGKPIITLDPAKTDTEPLYRARLSFHQARGGAVCSSLHKRHLKCSSSRR